MCVNINPSMHRGVLLVPRYLSRLFFFECCKFFSKIVQQLVGPIHNVLLSCQLGSICRNTHTHTLQAKVTVYNSVKWQMPSEPYNSLANDLCEFKQY